MATVNVVLAAQGYPTKPEMGAVIGGLDLVPEDVIVFHAGTKADNGNLLVNGGRVLNLVGTGTTVEEARRMRIRVAFCGLAGRSGAPPTAGNTNSKRVPRPGSLSTRILS